jgi:CDP-glycerol glycerophosphotransferase
MRDVRSDIYQKVTKRALTALSALRNRPRPAVSGLVVFSNMDGQGYGCNPKYICEELRNRSIDSLKLVWLFKPNIREHAREIPAGVRAIAVDSPEAEAAIRSAKLVVCNTGNQFLRAPKARDGFFLHTGHGSLGIKRVGSDMHRTVRLPSSPTVVIGRRADAYLVNSTFESETVARALYLHNKTLPFGHPRSDRLATANHADRVAAREHLSLSTDETLLLLIPTRRTLFSKTVNGVAADVREQVEKATGTPTIAYVRNHPSRESEDVLLSRRGIQAVRRLPDATDLMLAADVIVSDYSSALFDATLIPIMPSLVAFTPDYNRYRRKPGLYFTYGETPILQTSRIEHIANRAVDGLGRPRTRERDLFHATLGVYERGNASAQTVDYLVSHLGIGRQE